jgi:hypothetical protein
MFYRTGTISLTNGSTAVTGAGTDFINGAAIGECIQAPDGKLYEILSIQSATALTLGQVYLGATASGQTYSIVPTQSYIRDLASQAATLVNDYATTNSNAFLITVADKATPVDTDRMAIKDVTTGLGKWVTLANVKSFLKTYFDSLVQTLTNKTINLSSNTLTGTNAQFNTAMSDADFATLAGTETLTNKTLTAPAINSPTGIVKGDVGLGNVDNTSDATKNAATATLTNKTIDLGSNTLSGTLAQFNTAVSDGDFAAVATLAAAGGAATVGNTPAGNIAATTVQAAINELDTEKAKAGANTDITGLTGLSGNVSFTGTGNRITGDFSNATVANRVMFQTSTVNGNTSVGAVPNGTAVSANYRAFGSADLANASFTEVSTISGLESRISAERFGAGAYLPMAFWTGGAERLRIDTSGNVLVTSPTGLGYGTGVGGMVTQATSKSTAVTLNKPCGRITMHNAELVAGAAVTFTVNNSLVTEQDLVLVNLKWGTLTYRLWVTDAVAGSFSLVLENRSNIPGSDAVQFSFAIIKGAAS